MTILKKTDLEAIFVREKKALRAMPSNLGIDPILLNFKSSAVLPRIAELLFSGQEFFHQ